MPASMPAQNVRDLPEWQAARAEYLAETDDPDETFARRVLAAKRMRDIEKAHAAAIKEAEPRAAPEPAVRAQPVDGLYDIPGAADQLSCSEMHVYRLISAGELPIVDISLPGARRTKTRIRVEDMAHYIEQKTRKPR